VPKQRPSMQGRMAETPRATSKADTLLMGQERERREVVELLIREIMPNRHQPRTSFVKESMDELAESIRLHGVLEPIIVRAISLTSYEGSGRQYELIAGERRWRAAALAGRETIPALALPESTSDQAALELAITENLQREDLHPIDEAIAFGRMQRDLGYSYGQIAERLGKSKGYVQNRLRLLQLDEDLQRLVIDRPDTLTHVYELARVTDPEQRRALIEAVRADSLSFVQTRARVQAILSPLAPAPEEQRPYLRKYDSDEIHDDRPGEATPTGGQSYLRKYDGDENHDDRPGEAAPARGDEAGAAPELGAAPIPRAARQQAEISASLSPHERQVLAAATLKVERFLDELSLLTQDDWAVLGPLALRLSDLLRQVGRSSCASTFSLL
jgi:ParB family transcriptional regulator, chromosome partitioning protein